MRRITLHRATLDNAGSYVDAGTEMEVGEMADRITAERADELIKTFGAVEVKATKQPAS